MLSNPDAALVETRDRKMYITLNRPELLNAQDTSMRQALNAAFDKIDQDGNLLVAIMRGAGRAFCAGADIKEAAQVRQANEGRLPDSFDGASHFGRCDRLTKPIIAVMHGYAVGGGLELALCCDMRVATTDALLGTPEARTIGGIPGVAVHRLTRMIPSGEALRILLSGQPITGQRAYDVGLVQDVGPDIDAAMTIANNLADDILECNPDSIRAIKHISRWPLMADISASIRFDEMSKSASSVVERTSYRGAEYLAERRAGRP